MYVQRSLGQVYYFALYALVTLSVAISSLSVPKLAHAQVPDLIIPVDCDLGQECLIVNYVDQGRGNDHLDYQCNSKTYHGHKGIDFATKNRRAMLEGVNVVAAYDGRVISVRDGEDDTIKDEEGFRQVKARGKECGNGVMLEHGKGWKTFYCHLKQNSIVVEKGDLVREGEALGQIGQSGWSEFPHLHFEVLKGERNLDPFTGLGRRYGCDKVGSPLWRDMPDYTPFALFDGGFSVGKPDFDAIKDGSYEALTEVPLNAPSLVYWVGLYHARAGDVLTMTIAAPDGSVFHEREIILKHNKKRPSYFFSGRKTTKVALMKGRYIGIVTLQRLNKVGEVVHEKSYRHDIDVK